MTMPKTSRMPGYFLLEKEIKPITPAHAYRQLNKAADFAGVEHVGNHAPRKTFSYWFYIATRTILSY